MKYYRLPGMTRRKALSLWWFNNVKRHYHNWRFRRMWRADPSRPTICPQSGAISPDAWKWATEQVGKIEARRAAGVEEKTITLAELKRKYRERH